MGDYFYIQLRRYAIKEYKFQQRKSLPGVNACLPVALMWIQEKLATSVLSRALGQEGTFSFGSADRIDTHQRNAAIMRSADQSQHVITDNTDISPLEAALGLVATPLPLSISRTRDSGNNSVVDLPETLTEVGVNLAPGFAVAIFIKVIQGEFETRAVASHCIAMYKSRGNKLHFFEPNAGAYAVHEAQGFMHAWIKGCEKRGWAVSLMFRFSDKDSWYRVYRRP
jgi:hypothetical protein